MPGLAIHIESPDLTPTVLVNLERYKAVRREDKRFRRANKLRE